MVVVVQPGIQVGLQRLDVLDADCFKLDDLKRGDLAISLDVPEVAALAFQETFRGTER